MAATWSKKYNYNFLCQEINEAIIRQDNGKISFDFFKFDPLLVILNSTVTLDPSIPESQKGRIIIESVEKSAATRDITLRKLQSAVSHQEKLYLTSENKRYILITSLSIAKHCRIVRQIINNCHISFHEKIEEKFESEIEKIKEDASYSAWRNWPKNYITVKISTKGRSTSEAVDNAIKSIDIFRAIINLYYNRMDRFRHSYNRREPVNKILLGPIHTLHLPSAELASDNWWYDPMYTVPTDPVSITKNLEEIYTFSNRIKKYICRNNLKKYITQSLIRYTQALDLRDWNSSFLNLWSILESLANAKPNESYDDIINRISFLYSDREYAKLILTHLRDYRNDFIHSGLSRSDIESLMYQLKNHVERVLEFMIVNKFKLKNLDDVAQFLSQSNNKSSLRKKIKMLKNVISFITD